MSVLKYSLSAFSQAQNAPEEFEEDIKQISTGSTNHSSIFLVIFPAIALELENIGPTCSSFNPLSILAINCNRR